MAGEIQAQVGASGTYYFIVRDRNANVWGGSTFAAYSSASYATYPIAMSLQGVASNFYIGNFPSTIVPGVYSIVVYRQVGGSPAEGDPFVSVGDYEWNGVNTLPLSDLATSGQVGTIAPIRIYRGQMLQNFPFYLVSSLDHVSPITSGITSGQISRDGGAFGALQSGITVNVGQGVYAVTLTSGDLLCNTAALIFNGINVSGGTSDPRVFSFVLQKSSGQF